MARQSIARDLFNPSRIRNLTALRQRDEREYLAQMGQATRISQLAEGYVAQFEHSPNTYRNYRKEILRFVVWCSDTRRDPFRLGPWDLKYFDDFLRDPAERYVGDRSSTASDTGEILLFYWQAWTEDDPPAKDKKARRYNRSTRTWQVAGLSEKSITITHGCLKAWYSWISACGITVPDAGGTAPRSVPNPFALLRGDKYRLKKSQSAAIRKDPGKHLQARGRNQAISRAAWDRYQVLATQLLDVCALTVQLGEPDLARVARLPYDPADIGFTLNDRLLERLIRGRLVVGLAYHLALRANEIATSPMNSVQRIRDSKASTPWVFVVMEGKGMESRTLRFSDPLPAWLSDYRAHVLGYSEDEAMPSSEDASGIVRPLRGLRDRPNVRERGVGTKVVYEVIVEEFARVARIATFLGDSPKLVAELERVTPHVLRHSRATHLVDVDTPVKDVARLLGHKDERTTWSNYVDLDPQTLPG